jgi:tetratricopeptide (TPR) repeat protein
MADDKRYLLAKLAFEQGDRFQARDHLTELLKEDQENIEYWLLMSIVVDSRKERIFCLKKVLALDPNNEEARLGLILFGGLDPGDVRPTPFRVKDWSKDLPDLRKKEKPKKVRKKSRYNYKQLLPLAVGSVVILVILFLTGVLFPGMGSIFSPKLTITPVTWTPLVDQELAAELTGTPNPIHQTPIGKVLQAPYTPTPAYVLTPHPGYGTYQTALEAYQQGDFETMLTYMRSTADQLETADIVFLVGEALRNLGRYAEAAREYERALFLDSSFAPAYYGRAMVTKVIDPEIEIKPDLDQALSLDPGFGEAYIERAEYYLDHHNYQLAYQDANKAVEYLPNSHLANLYRSWALLELQDIAEAKIAVELALELDINHVPTYLIAGRIYLESGNPQQAVEFLTKYDPYVTNKPWEFYYALGKAHYLSGDDLVAAVDLLNRAESEGGINPSVFQTRSQVYLSQGNLDLAVHDAYSARNLDKEDFDLNLYLGKTLFQDGQITLAVVYLNDTENLAQLEADLAKVYYWRAQVLEKANRFEESQRDWEMLLSLPREYVPDEWEYIAEEKLLPTATPTPTITPSPTNTPTPTLTSTSTPSATPTPTRTSTPQITNTQTITLTPTKTP